MSVAVDVHGDRGNLTAYAHVNINVLLFHLHVSMTLYRGNAHAAWHEPFGRVFFRSGRRPRRPTTTSWLILCIYCTATDEPPTAYAHVNINALLFHLHVSTKPSSLGEGVIRKDDGRGISPSRFNDTLPW